MHTAIKLQKPILVVFNQSKITVQTALKWIPLELKPLLNNELLPVNEDVQMIGTCIDRIMAAKTEPRFRGCIFSTLRLPSFVTCK